MEELRPGGSAGDNYKKVSNMVTLTLVCVVLGMMLMIIGFTRGADRGECRLLVAIGILLFVVGVIASVVL